jgi:hypothetical protein
MKNKLCKKLWESNEVIGFSYKYIGVVIWQSVKDWLFI